MFLINYKYLLIISVKVINYHECKSVYFTNVHPRWCKNVHPTLGTQDGRNHQPLFELNKQFESVADKANQKELQGN